MNRDEFKVAQLTIGETDVLLPLLATSRFKPLRFLPADPVVDLNAYWIKQVQGWLQSPNSAGLQLVHEGKVAGFLVHSANPWESNLLGKQAVVLNTFIVDHSLDTPGEAAGLLLDAALQEFQQRKVDYILCKACTDDNTMIHAAESRGFLLMDCILDCTYDFKRRPFEQIAPPATGEGVTIRMAAPGDRDELALVAGEAFKDHFGRFHADERIGRELATRFYQQWIHSSLDGYADFFIVAEVKGRVVGFSIWKLPSSIEKEMGIRLGHYSLGGIHPEFHGRGIFTSLTYAGMQSIHKHVDIIEGPTHINNYGVQIGYARLGWRICSDSRLSFHKWID